MRPFGPVRPLLVAGLTASLVLGTVALAAGSAYAAKIRSKPITCRTLSGTYGGSWNVIGCTQPAITGSGSDSSVGITPAFTSGMTTATVTWLPGARRGGPPDTTTLSLTVMTTKKNKCSASMTEYEILGKVTGNSANFNPAVKVNSKVKAFLCVHTGSGALSNVVKNRRFPVKF
jgi:hypothetical protein